MGALGRDQQTVVHRAAQHPCDDRVEQALQLSAVGCGDFVAARRLTVLRVDPVQRDHMKVQIEIDRAVPFMKAR